MDKFAQKLGKKAGLRSFGRGFMDAAKNFGSQAIDGATMGFNRVGVMAKPRLRRAIGRANRILDITGDEALEVGPYNTGRAQWIQDKLLWNNATSNRGTVKTTLGAGAIGLGGGVGLGGGIAALRAPDLSSPEAVQKLVKKRPEVLTALSDSLKQSPKLANQVINGLRANGLGIWQIIWLFIKNLFGAG